MNPSPNQTQEIADAILDILQEKNGPCEPAELIADLGIKFDPWKIRQVIWDLTSKAVTDLTWDRKLILGEHSGRAAA